MAATKRAIRSYVIREGRMTAAQTRALSEQYPRFNLSAAIIADPASDFRAGRPLVLEVGFGNGENLVRMASAMPASTFLGCEVHRPGLGHALQLAHAAKLSNLALWNLDVVDGLAVLPPSCFDAIGVFFPDPWPKKRHHKRRLLTAQGLDALNRGLKAGGRLHFASDHQAYAEQVLELIDSDPSWCNLAGVKRWAPRPKWRLVSRFESRAVKAGRPIFELLAAPVSNPAQQTR